MTKVLVHAPPTGAVADRLGVAFGRARRDDDGTLLTRVRPAQWLLFGDAGRGADVVQRWESAAGDAGEFVSVLDVTAGRTVLRLTGDAAPELLAKICALDLEDDPERTDMITSLTMINAEIERAVA